MHLYLLLLLFKFALSAEDHARAGRSPQFNSWGLPQWGGAPPGTPPQQGGLLGGLLSQLGSQQGGLLGQMGQPAGRVGPRGPPPTNNGGIIGSIMRGIQNNQGGGILDIGRGITDELKVLAGGPPPSNWQQHARKFCRRFPGHPKCRGGQMPLFEEISLLITEVADGGLQYLPRIPQLNIRDPLQGVPGTLAQIGRQLQYGHVLDGSVASGMQRVCRGQNCRQQTTEYSDKRTRVHSKLAEFEKTVYGKDTSEAIELRFGRVQQIKKALLEKAGIASVVEPANDGVFDKDILLTENQANFLLNELGKGGQGADPYKDLPAPAASGTRAKTMRGKRSSIFFEENPVQKWDPNTPIPYTLHSSLEEFDKNDIRSALQEISSKTCLRFQYVASPRTAHLNYMKVDSPTFCGLSYIGKVSPANPIYLSFQCGNSVGVAIHETMHALGVGHQHLRPDRDSYLQIDWSNVNPQHYDYFAVLDSKMYTSYGTPYAYDSIMHYNAYTAAVDISKPTMRPKYDYNNNVRLLGQRDRMSVRDVEILKKMYCMPGCVDRNVYCGAWALKNLCNAQANTAWMRQNCQKSCGFCNAG